MCIPQKCIASRNLTKNCISQVFSDIIQKCILSNITNLKYAYLKSLLYICNPWKKDGTTVHNSFFHKLYLSSSRNLGKLFFHSVSRLNLVALKASACCSIVSRTIFQKHSDTAKLRFLVVIWDELTTPPLKIEVKNN